MWFFSMHILFWNGLVILANDEVIASNIFCQGLVLENLAFHWYSHQVKQPKMLNILTF